MPKGSRLVAAGAALWVAATVLGCGGRGGPPTTVGTSADGSAENSSAKVADAQAGKSGSGPSSGDLPTGGGPDNPPPPKDPWVGLKAEERKLLERLDGMLGKIAQKGGVADGAATRVVESVRDAERRATLLMKLSRYRLDIRPETMPKVLALVKKVKAVGPEGSLYRHVSARTGREPLAVQGRYALGMHEVASTLRSQVKAGKPFNKKARDVHARLEGDLGPVPRPVHFVDEPDVVGKVLRETLTVGDFAGYLSDLESHAKAVEFRRDRDARLHALIGCFEDVERFRILQAMSANIYVEQMHNFGSDPRLSGEYNDCIPKKGRAFSPLEIDRFKEFREAGPEQRRRIVDAYPFGEKEKERQEWLGRMFVEPDRRAVASLAEIQAARDELAAFLKAAVPDFDWDFRPLVPPGPDGKPLLTPLGPVPFKFIDPKVYVVDYDIDASGRFYIAHNFDD